MTIPQQAEVKRTEISQRIRIIRMKEVREITGLGTTAIYDRIKAGTFPQKINLGNRAIGFLESDIQNWISERIEASQVA